MQIPLKSFPEPSAARMHLTKLILAKQDQVIDDLVPKVPGLRSGLIDQAKPEAHYEHLFREELRALTSNETWQNRMLALYVNGQALAWWALKRDGVPIIESSSISSLSEDFAEPKLYDPYTAIAHWRRTIPLTDDEAQALIDNLKDLRGPAEDAAQEYVKVVMDSISELFKKAVSDNLPLTEFRKQFADVVPGRAKNVIEQIYRTNLTKAYAQERLTTIQQAGIRVPFMQYLTIPDDRRTVICKAMSGYIAATQDEIWDVWVPPNHYGCRSDLSPIPYLEAIRRGFAQKTPDRKGLVLLKGPRPLGNPPHYAIDPKNKRMVIVYPQEGFRRGEKFGLAA